MKEGALAPNGMNDRNVVIIGGGFAGSRLARSLERQLPREWQIHLLSRENFITYHPLLPEVVGASVLPGHVVAPLRQMVGRTRVCMVKVIGIDREARTVDYIGEGPGNLPFEHLVLACGQNANLALVKGMDRYALPLKTLGDALFLRNRLVARLEQAELQPDREARRWLTTFIVVGGGFSGVEVAGEIIDFLHASLRYYPRIERGDCRVVLLHGTDRLLPELSPSLGRFALRKMCMAGLDIRLQARVVGVNDRGVHLDNGDFVVGGTVICTIGTAPNPLVAELGLPTVRGRIETAPDMSVPGHPGIWALGDCAAVPNAHDGKICPPTAQFADRQAITLARNLCEAIAGRPTGAFGYKPAGQLSSIGHNRAVAEIFGVRVSGFVAWLLWRGVYLLKIPTLARKVRLYLEWNWAMFFPPDISHFRYTRTQRGAPSATGVGNGKGAPTAA
jgi:NADH dehydrogenase